MRCTICKEECLRQSDLEPAESCMCGEMAYTSPWKWDGFWGIYNYVRYWIARKAIWLSSYIILKGYRGSL